MSIFQLSSDRRQTLLIRIGIPVLAGIIALFIPLLRDLHFESAMVASVLGCFIAARVAAKAEKRAPEGWNLLRIMGWVYLPALVLLTATLIRGCFSADGLLYWIFNPPLSILFGYAVGRYFRVNGFRRSVVWANVVLVVVAVGIFLFELFTLPQVYFFNHVWGHWPGPIYDEEVTFSTSVILFRFITLCWVGLFWLMPHFWERRQAQYLTFLVLGGLVLSYLRLSEAGIVSPNEYIEARLGTALQTEYAEIHYPAGYLPEQEKNRISELNDFHIREIRDTLNITSDERISAYIYAHPWQKKQLTGAKHTSYVPVWTSRHQYHINRQAVDGSLRHELVHVIAKDFGNRILNASWSVGLVEGLAVALSPAEQRRATVDQMVAANEAWLEADELERLFSVTGFYREGGPMSYSIAGSFVQYLLRNYPVEKFKQAYRRSSLAAGYDTPIDSLQAGWKRHLQTIEMVEEERLAGLRAFAIPSIFDQDCPRRVTSYQEAMDRGRLLVAERDTVAALQAFGQAADTDPDAVAPVWQKLQLLALQGAWQDILDHEVPEEKEWLPALLVQADAHKAAGETEEAERLLSISDSLAAEAGQYRREVSVRKEYWQDFIQLNYSPKQVRLDFADRLTSELQWMWLRQLYALEAYDKLIDFAHSLQPEYRPEQHGIFIRVVEFLAANGYPEAARSWIDLIETDQLRPMMQYQINQVRRFADFAAVEDR